MENITETIKSEIEATAKALGIMPSTVGKLVGQGGKFYERMSDGKLIWPHTADKVLLKLREMREKAEAS